MSGINESIADERSQRATESTGDEAIGYGLAAVTSGLLEVAAAIRDAGSEIANAMKDR